MSKIYWAVPKQGIGVIFVLAGTAAIIAGVWQLVEQARLFGGGLIITGVGLAVGAFVAQGEQEAMDLDSSQSAFWLSVLPALGGLIALTGLFGNEILYLLGWAEHVLDKRDIIYPTY